jgi:hypothetical protein
MAASRLQTRDGAHRRRQAAPPDSSAIFPAFVGEALGTKRDDGDTPPPRRGPVVLILMYYHI